MHCPRCGQQQAAETTRFCSRCGLPLDLVAEVVANNGSLPYLQSLLQKKQWFTRKTGFKLAAVWFIVWVLLLLPLSGAADAPDRVSGSLAILGFFGSFLISMVSWMFLPKEMRLNVAVPAYQPDQNQYLGAARQGALPPQQSIPVSAYAPPAPGSWRETNDLQPASVTDGTTRIFNESESK
jgi:hypothetical protein